MSRRLSVWESAPLFFSKKRGAGGFLRDWASALLFFSKKRELRIFFSGLGNSTLVLFQEERSGRLSVWELALLFFSKRRGVGDFLRDWESALLFLFLSKKRGVEDFQDWESALLALTFALFELDLSVKIGPVSKSGPVGATRCILHARGRVPVFLSGSGDARVLLWLVLPAVCQSWPWPWPWGFGT